MFLDEPRMPEPWRHEEPRPKLTKRSETVLLWLIGLNLIMLLIAPIGGATVIQALAWLLTRAG